MHSQNLHASRVSAGLAKRALLAAALALAVTVASLALPSPASAAQFTSDFMIEQCRFSPNGRNAYFSVERGDQLIYEGEEDGETVRLEITVLDETERIVFQTPRGETVRVRARVIEERESIDGEIFEISRNYYARCRQTGEIYYFGELVEFFEDGEVVNNDGSWRAGEEGAQPGLIMPATFLLGARYFQEVAPGIAEDQAKHSAMGLTATTPAGTFVDCVEVTETTPLEPDAEEFKIYCPGIGLVSDGEELELVDFDLE